jgi:hypothetical protein
MKRIFQSFFFVAFLVCVSACKKPDMTPGMEYLPDGDLIQAGTEYSFDLNVSCAKVDSFRTDVFANFLCGNYIDDLFGTTKCTGYFQIAPDPTLPELPDTFEVYDVLLRLAYQPFAYGANVPMYFSVKEIAEPFQLDSPYYSNKRLQTANGNCILEGNETQTTRTEYAEISGDTRVFLEIPLKISLGEKLMAMDSLFNDVEGFRGTFPGLAISSSTVNGRVLSFYSIDSEVVLKYRYTEDGRSKSGSYTFSFSSSSEAYTFVERQYYGSALVPLSNGWDEVATNQTTYLQGGGGTRVNIDINDALRLRDLAPLTINKAEIIVPFNAAEKLEELDSIGISYRTTDGGYSLLPDALITPGGQFRKTDHYYRFAITSFLQGLINGDHNHTALVLSASGRIANLYNSLGIKRSVLHGPAFSADTTQNMRLVVTYTR